MDLRDAKKIKIGDKVKYKYRPLYSRVIGIKGREYGPKPPYFVLNDMEGHPITYLLFDKIKNVDELIKEIVSGGQKEGN